MKPLLDRDHYLSEDVLRSERERIFYQQWQFAGVSLNLPNHNDFILVRVAEKEVIVQNFKGQLSAFTNVCSHRYSAIHTCAKGNRPLQCPYHRWAYDSDGIPRGIPEREEFRELRDDIVKLESLRLERWSLALCGTLIFIRLATNGVSLEEFLGDQFTRLERISGSFQYEILSWSGIYLANWKLVMQNTLEAYHVPSVHPNTFGRLPTPTLEAQVVPFPHLRYLSHQPVTRDASTDGARARTDRALRACYAKSALGEQEESDDLVNELLLLWPASTFGHTSGRAFVLFAYTPTAPDRTELRVTQWYPALQDATPEDEALRTRFSSLITGFITQVADEDRTACEAVQRGIRNARTLSGGLIGDHENMVHQFQQHYLTVMEH